MPDVFISYSHKDSVYAHRLADELRRRGVDAWIDERIDYGDQWPRVIQNNLTASRAFILVMSTNSFDSMWVQNDVSYAQANNKPIYPLLLEGQVWLSMAAMQYVDVRNGEMPPGRFFNELREDLNQPILSAREQMKPIARKPAPPKSRRALYVAGSILLCVALICVATPIVWRMLSPMFTPQPPQPVKLSPAPAQPSAVPEPVKPPPIVTEEPSPTPEPADIYTPNPLGPEFSGMWIAVGTCYDMDILYTSEGEACDLVLEQDGLLFPVYGALLSGYAFDTEPDLVKCIEVISIIQNDDPVAVQSDLYMCFLTNAGRYGFFVARQIDIQNGIAFDAYLFP